MTGKLLMTFRGHELPISGLAFSSDGQWLAAVSERLPRKTEYPARLLARKGKLLIWSFVAGYSEKFVTGILKQLERQQARPSDD